MKPESPRRRPLVLFVVTILSVVPGLLQCSPYSQQLERGEHYYQENQYEQALAILRELGRHEGSLSTLEQARFAYLRGMTDYRLGFLDDARYWLSLAKATESLRPGGLDPAWPKRLDLALLELTQTRGAREIQGKDREIQVLESPLPASNPK